MTLKQTKAKGFTIVELLIVVVVIAILAAITIVAYNGIQNRAKASSAQSAASSVQKKAEAYNIDGPTSAYNTTLAQLTGATSDKSYYLAPGSVTLRTTALVAGTAPSSADTINFYTCNSAKGYRVQYYDFNTNTVGIINGGDQSAGTCTLATT